MHEFLYDRPRDVSAVVAALEDDPESLPLSGGMTLLPTMKQRLAAPSRLLDLTGIDALRGIQVEEGDRLVIGACTTHAEVATSRRVTAFAPGLASLAALIGDPAVRNRGTIGGSVANNDPAADYPAALLALGAEVETDRRRLPAGEFFVGLFETALEPAEIIVAVRFERPLRSAYAKFRHPASRFAMTGVFAAQLGDGSPRIAVTGAGSDGVFRWIAAEEVLSGIWSEAAIAGLPLDEDQLMSDFHAGADYRAALVSAMTRQAVRDA